MHEWQWSKPSVLGSSVAAAGVASSSVLGVCKFLNRRITRGGQNSSSPPLDISRLSIPYLPSIPIPLHSLLYTTILSPSSCIINSPCTPLSLLLTSSVFFFSVYSASSLALLMLALNDSTDMGLVVMTFTLFQRHRG